MKGKKHSSEQIIEILRQAEAELNGGVGIGQVCQKLAIPVRLVIGRSRLTLESVLWREYWEPAREFFEVDLCLRQRLNRLKKAWRNLRIMDSTPRRAIT